MFKIVELTNLNEKTMIYPQVIHSAELKEAIKQVLLEIFQLNQQKKGYERFYQIYLETEAESPRILSFDWHFPMGEFEKGEWVCTYDSQEELEQDYLRQMNRDIQSLKST